jgi:hypothetical protein
MSEYKTYDLIDKDTGEVIDSKTVETKVGRRTGISTSSEDQRDAYKHKLELDKEMADFIKENEGAFIHLIYKYGSVIFKELEEKLSGNKSNIHIIRFIILATYMTFGGKLFDDDKNRIKKSSLKHIWDTTNRNSVNETYNLLLECGYIYLTEEGYIMINEKMIIKGEITDIINELKKEDGRYTYTRVFVNNIKSMYYGTEQKQRKQLANLFKILPYVNFKYNVFCSNPTETDEMKLELLSWGDLAKLCGYDRTNVTRFKKDLWNLKIYDHCVIGEFHCKSGMAICVNPKVYYGGDDVSDVRNLYAMFKMCEKSI